MATELNPQQIKKQILHWLSSLRDRQRPYSFRLIQAHLRRHGMLSAQGWEPLLEKYRELNYENKSIDWGERIKALSSLHRNSVLAGNSAVWLFNAEDDIVERMTQHLEVFLKQRTAFASTFPHQVPHDVLLAQSVMPEFVFRGELEDGDIALVACRKRVWKQREQIVVSELDDDARDAFDEYEELIGIKTIVLQAYDRLIFRPGSRRVEVHVDLCCPLTTDELQQDQQKYVAKLKQVLSPLLGSPFPWLNQPVNLFPFIDKLYRANDGEVIGLGHATGTGSVKKERMRKRGDDLRKEPFHTNGINAIQRTDPFFITKGWNGQLGNTAMVTISGHSHQGGAANAAVWHAILENCASLEDQKMILDHFS